jgi:hypothetical protein
MLCTCVSEEGGDGVIECMFHTPYLSRDLRVGVNDERVQ